MAKLMNGMGIELESATEMPVALYHSLGAPPHGVNSVVNGNGHVGDHHNSLIQVHNGHVGHSQVLEMEQHEDSGFECDIADSAQPKNNGKWKPFFIGVAGGTASGKTSVCHKIMAMLGQHDLDHHERRVVTISSDSFYRVLNAEERVLAGKGEFNFDHPDALDYDLILRTMYTLLSGEIANIPVYDFVTHSRIANEYIRVYPADVVLFEGILVFYFTELRNLFQLKLFVDTDADTRLARRVVRDLKDRGRDLPSVIHQYTLFVKPAFEEFCQPTKKYADVIIPRGADNEVAINLIVQHIKEHLLPLAQENGSPRRSSQEETAVVAVGAVSSQKKSMKDAKSSTKPFSSCEKKMPLALTNGNGKVMPLDPAELVINSAKSPVEFTNGIGSGKGMPLDPAGLIAAAAKLVVNGGHKETQLL